MKKTTTVFVQVPNYWAATESLEASLRWISGESGRSVSELRRGKLIALEFPADADIQVSPVHGDWTAAKAPLRLVATNGLGREQIANLKKLIRKGRR